MKVKHKLPPLHDAQKAIVRALDTRGIRTVTAVCGRRFGKTQVALAYAVKLLSEGRSTLWLGPVFRTILIAWKRAKKLLGPLVRAGVVSFSESTMTLTWGAARIDFRSAEAGAGLRGEGGYALIVAEEAQDIPEDVFENVVRPMQLDAPGSKVLNIGTPKGTDDRFARAFRKGQDKVAGFASLAFPSSANPHLDAAEIDAAREDMSASAAARELDAKFVPDDAVVFPKLLRGSAAGELAYMGLGIDLAISKRQGADSTAMVVCGVDSVGSTHVVYAERGHWSFAQMLSAAERIAAKFDVSTICIEQVAYQAAAVEALQSSDELREIDVRGIVPKGDKRARASMLSARVANGSIVFAHDLADWFTGQMTGFPLAKHDDGVDAFVLGYHAATLAIGGTHTWDVDEEELASAAGRRQGFMGERRTPRMDDGVITYRTASGKVRAIRAT